MKLTKIRAWDKEIEKFITVDELVFDKKGNIKVEIGNSLAKKKSKDEKFLRDYVAKGTLPNQLYLTEMMENNVKKIEPVLE